MSIKTNNVHELARLLISNQITCEIASTASQNDGFYGFLVEEMVVGTLSSLFQRHSCYDLV